MIVKSSLSGLFLCVCLFYAHHTCRPACQLSRSSATLQKPAASIQSSPDFYCKLFVACLSSFLPFCLLSLSTYFHDSPRKLSDLATEPNPAKALKPFGPQAITDIHYQSTLLPTVEPSSCLPSGRLSAGSLALPSADLQDFIPRQTAKENTATRSLSPPYTVLLCPIPHLGHPNKLPDTATSMSALARLYGY